MRCGHVGDFAATVSDFDRSQEEAARQRARAQVHQRLCGGDFRWIVLEASECPTGAVAVVDAYAAPTLGGRSAAMVEAWRSRAELQQRQWLASEASLRMMREDPLRRLYDHRRAALVAGELPDLAWGRLPRHLQGLLTPASGLHQSGDVLGAHLALSEAETAIASFYGFAAVVGLEAVRELFHDYCGLRIGDLCGDADTLARGKRSGWSRPAERSRVESVASKAVPVQTERDRKRGKQQEEAERDEDPELKARLKEQVERRRKQLEEKQRKVGERRARSSQNGTPERKETEEERRKRMWRQAQAWVKEDEEEDEAASKNPRSASRVQPESGSNGNLKPAEELPKSTRRLRMEERRRRERGITSGAESEEAWTDSSFSPPRRTPSSNSPESDLVARRKQRMAERRKRFEAEPNQMSTGGGGGPPSEDFEVMN